MPGPDPRRDLPRLVDATVQLSFAVQGILTAVAANHELSVTQARLLGILRDREPSMLDLARFLGLQKSSVTGLVDRAEERGLVRRSPGPRDGRSTHVALTAAGRRLVGGFAGQVGTGIADLLADLDAGERAELTRLAVLLVERDALRRGIDLAATG